MARRSSLLLAALVSLCVAACSGLENAPYIEPPDLIDQLANANLSPPPGARAGPTRPYGANGFETEPRVQKFPGDDRSVAPRKDFSGVAEGRNGYELNFSDAELSELAKVILRDTLEIAYVYDPRVQGRVTVSTGGPVSRGELLSILEAVLAMNHGALIVEGKLYRIVPESEGKQQAVASFDYAKESKEIGAGYGVSILPLKYVSSDTMTRLLESLAAKREDLRTSLYNNLLIIRGTGRERQSLVEIVSMFDVDWMKGQSAAIVTLMNSAPGDIIKELQQVFQADGQGKGLVRFQPIDRMNAILVLTQKSQLLNDVETWVERLDRSGTEGESYYVYRVENGRAKDLADILTSAFATGGGTVRAAEESEVAPGQAAVRMESPPNGEEGAAAPETARQGPAPAAAEAAAAAPAPTAAGSDAVRITADERNNKLLIKASARDYRKILGILRRIDQPPLQVLINATLAEVTLNDNLAYGVQFFLQQHNGDAGGIGFTNGADIAIAPAVPGLNFIVGNIAGSPRVILDALARETAVRVVSSPSVVVLHNQPATLQVGDEIPITTRQAVSVVNPDAPVVNEIQFRNTGVILKVTPRINSNGLVTMEVEQEISQVARSGGGESLTPTISQRRITSTIAVQSGQMVVLGGLISEQIDHDKSRIPVLGKIPYLGDIIGGNTERSKARTELVVFLQPSVIRDAHDASNVAEAIRGSMQSLAPRPAPWDAQVEATAPQPVKFK